MRNRETKDQKEGVAMHDSCALYYVIHPEWFTSKEEYVSIIEDGERIGETYKTEKGNKIKVVYDLNKEVFINRIKEIYKTKLS